MIRVVAVASNEIGSRVIRWGLGEPASHLAIVTSEIAIHVVGKGVESTRATGFWQHYRLVEHTHFRASVDAERRVIDDLLLMTRGVQYDWNSLAWFAWHGLLRKTLGRPVPLVNRFDDRDRSLCVELVYAFLESWAKITGESITMHDGQTWGTRSPLSCVLALRESRSCSPRESSC